MMIDDWYYDLNKSNLNPPQWIFPIVWTILYIMIGFSLWFYLKDGIFVEKIPGGIIFLIQMALNFLWSRIFFTNHNPKGALIVNILLWIFTGLNIYFFMQYSQIAGILLIPYFLWISFAIYLNFYIVKNN